MMIDKNILKNTIIVLNHIFTDFFIGNFVLKNTSNLMEQKEDISKTSFSLDWNLL